MKYKGLIPLMLFIAIIAALTFTMTKFQLTSATPSKPTWCADCHAPAPLGEMDSNVMVTVTEISSTETTVTYSVEVTGPYEEPEGWAVFDAWKGNNIINGYSPGTFTVDRGYTYYVLGVDDSDIYGVGRGGGANYVELLVPTVPVLVHDVAITGITAPSTATESDLVSVVVDLANTGDYDESFDLKFLIDGSIEETRSVTLAEGTTTSETFTWTAVVGTHILAAETVVAGDATPANNYAETSIDVSPVVLVHDIAITEVTVSPTELYVSDPVYIDVTVTNEGDYSETFDVYVYTDIDTTVIGDETTIDIITGVSLGAGASTTLSVTWDTTGVVEGAYIISAEVPPVPDEEDTVDNTFTDDAVTITTPAILSVTVDFDSDTLNLKSMGKWVTCYIELTGGYDVEDINVSTIRLEGFIPAETDPKYGFVRNLEIKDRDGDGISELMVKFDRQAVIEYIRDVLGIIDGHVTLTITGELTDSTLFEGVDTIKVISKGRD